MGCGFLRDTEGRRLCNPITCRGMWKKAGNSVSKIENCASRPGKALRGTKSEASTGLEVRSHSPQGSDDMYPDKIWEGRVELCGCEWRVKKRVPHSARDAKTSHCVFAVAVTLGLEVNFNFKKTWGCHARTEQISDPYTILISPETEYQSTVSLSYLFLPAWKAETGIKMSMMNAASICSATRDIKKIYNHSLFYKYENFSVWTYFSYSYV